MLKDEVEKIGNATVQMGYKLNKPHKGIRWPREEHEKVYWAQNPARFLHLYYRINNS